MLRLGKKSIHARQCKTKKKLKHLKNLLTSKNTPEKKTKPSKTLMRIIFYCQLDIAKTSPVKYSSTAFDHESLTGALLSLRVQTLIE